MAEESKGPTDKAPSSLESAKKPKSGAKKTCFTIMPFGDWFDEYYETVYTPAIEAAGLQPVRADDFYRPSTIVNDVWELTHGAKLVLADLTGKNPNVFYELGLAHALRKPAILITESLEHVPFDLRGLRIIVYEKNDPSWGAKLSNDIKSSIREVLASPLDAVLPTFMDMKTGKAKKGSTKSDKQVESLLRELDVLRREVRMGRHITRSLDSREASSRIRQYLLAGMPEMMIAQRIEDMGVPRYWVEREIQRLRSTLRRPRAPRKAKKAR